MGGSGQHEHARDAEQHQSAHGRPGSKGDITKIQNETQVLSRTVSEKIGSTGRQSFLGGVDKQSAAEGQCTEERKSL